MHMADALLSPAVGVTMWGVSATAIAYSSVQLKKEVDERKVPLMGVLAAFLFAAQMINFTIPATGSSGHLGGGLLLAMLLGPHGALLTVASVLTMQALFFADGGLLALGCNIFNLGLIPAFIAYPLIYRPITGEAPSKAGLAIGSMIAAIIGLQLGSLSVVLETAISGLSAIPISTFLTLMQPIHLAIGLVEGVVTAAIAGFILNARPDIFNIELAKDSKPAARLVPSILILALLIGGGLSLFASKNPDGLEWSISRSTGIEELKSPDTALHSKSSWLQQKLSILPDYNFKNGDSQKASSPLGTSISGIVGALATLLFSIFIGFALRKKQQRAATKPHTHEHAHPHLHEHDHSHSHGGVVHSHDHEHKHSHPHPHLHNHHEAHHPEPDRQHSHRVEVAPHNHDHNQDDHGDHDHDHRNIH